MSDNQYMNRNTNGSRSGGNYGGYNDAQRRTSGSPARTPSGAGRPQTGGSSVPVRRGPAQPVRSQQPDRSRAVVKRNSGHPAKKTAAKTTAKKTTAKKTTAAKKTSTKKSADTEE